MNRESFAKKSSMIYPSDKYIAEHCEAVGYPMVKQIVVDGKIQHQLEFVVTDEEPEYKVKDFALENLLAAQVPLTEMRIEPMNLTKASEFAQGLENLPSLNEPFITE